MLKRGWTWGWMCPGGGGVVPSSSIFKYFVSKKKKRNKKIKTYLLPRCQRLTSLGPYLFAGGGDMALGPSSSPLVVVVRVKEVV